LYPNLGPYHISRLRALSKHLDCFTAIEISSSEEKYPWGVSRRDTGFKFCTLFDKPFERISHAEQKRAVRGALDELQPEGVMVTGYYEAGMRAAATWARKHSVPCVMTTDSTQLDKPRSWPKEFLKGLWSRHHYDALFLPGVRSKTYFTGLKFPEECIWLYTSVVDNDFFEERSRNVKRGKGDDGSRLAVPHKYFFTVARLSPEKNIRGLLAAFSSYRKQGGRWHLVIAGSGPQEQELKKLTVDQSITEVHFIGWKSYDELPAYYALASCFILPSISEPWGLVVNEAMACGLPVLVSRMCGCQPDLCFRGVNGYDFDPYNTDELADLMLQFSGGEMDLDVMGRQSRKIIANYTPETWALSLKDCFLTLLANFADMG
jgi:glycosyltransferase involved in cell wall biosynthesis